MHPEDEQAQSHKQRDDPADRPNVGFRGRHVPYAAVGRPIVGVAVICARTRGGCDPGGPVEEAADLLPFLSGGNGSGKESVGCIAVAKRALPELLIRCQGLHLGRAQPQGAGRGIVGVRFHLATRAQFDQIAFFAGQLGVAPPEGRSREVLTDRFACPMERHGGKLHAALGSVPPHAAVIHEPISLVHILSSQDIRSRKKQIPVRSGNPFRIRRRLPIGKYAANEQPAHRNQKTDNRCSLQMW